MKDPEKPSSVIDLADRRPTPKELPAFAPPEPDPEQVRLKDEFWATMEPFYEGLQVIQAELLSRLLRLTLPELKHIPLFSVREVSCKSGRFSEKQMRDWEARLGTVPTRVRQARWLDDPAYPLLRDPAVRGIEDAQPGDSGVIIGRELYLLGDGRLGLIDLTGMWMIKADGTYDTLTTLADAHLIEPSHAVREFHLQDLVATLRYILWNDRGTPLASRDAETEARRARFLATVKDLSKATAAYVDRIRRAGIGPV
jgi:hypothetical protein